MNITNIPPITVQTFNMKLLEKVEELTLHLIEQEKAMQLLNEASKKQQKEIDQLKSEIK